jgi:hypothetical protein
MVFLGGHKFAAPCSPRIGLLRDEWLTAGAPVVLDGWPKAGRFARTWPIHGDIAQAWGLPYRETRRGCRGAFLWAVAAEGPLGKRWGARSRPVSGGGERIAAHEAPIL